MDDGTSPDASTVDPEEAFGLVSHEIRLGVLLALWDAPDHSLSFSELNEAVGVGDKGQFNYHLSQLVGQFVDHVDDRYQLRYAGHRVIDAIQTGVFHEFPTVEGVELDGTCPACCGGLAFAYDDHLGTVACQDCGEKVFEYPFDPGGLAGRSGPEAAAAFGHRTREFWTQALGGVCGICSGPTEGDVVESSVLESLSTFEELQRYDDFFAADHPALVELDCRRCSFYSYVPVGAVLLAHPGVVGALYDRGIDVRERPPWELPFLVGADRVTVAGRDPWDLRVTASAGHEDLVVSVDGTPAVTAIERRPGE